MLCRVSPFSPYTAKPAGLLNTIISGSSKIIHDFRITTIVYYYAIQFYDPQKILLYTLLLYDIQNHVVYIVFFLKGNW